MSVALNYSELKNRKQTITNNNNNNKQKGMFIPHGPHSICSPKHRNQLVPKLKLKGVPHIHSEQTRVSQDAFNLSDTKCTIL